jgi:hypothetical protein
MNIFLLDTEYKYPEHREKFCFKISNFTAEMGSRKSYSAFGTLKLMFTPNTQKVPLLRWLNLKESTNLCQSKVDAHLCLFAGLVIWVCACLIKLTGNKGREYFWEFSYTCSASIWLFTSWLTSHTKASHWGERIFLELVEEVNFLQASFRAYTLQLPLIAASRVYSNCCVLWLLQHQALWFLTSKLGLRAFNKTMYHPSQWKERGCYFETSDTLGRWNSILTQHWLSWFANTRVIPPEIRYIKIKANFPRESKKIGIEIFLRSSRMKNGAARRWAQ